MTGLVSLRASGTWCERHVPSVCNPSTLVRPVRPLLASGSTIIRATADEPRRAAHAVERWIEAIFSTTVSTAAAMASCIWKWDRARTPKTSISVNLQQRG